MCARKFVAFVSRLVVVSPLLLSFSSFAFGVLGSVFLAEGRERERSAKEEGGEDFREGGELRSEEEEEEEGI